MSDDEIIIVGAGLAGLRATERLRERGYDGYITMVGDEPEVPYNRPPLSKQILMGKMRESDLGFQTFTQLSVELMAGRRATSLDPHRGCIELDTGEELFYDGLIIASGVEARKIPDAPVHDERVTVLRTLADSHTLHQLLHGARRVAIIGGGFIGCEVAASARALALDVTLIDRAPVLLNRVLGPHLGGVLRDVHEQAGVDVRSSTSVVEWSTGKAGVRLGLSDGTSVLADVVVAAIGTTPCVDWLAGNDLDLDNGVLCDETCHVVGIDNVVAAGDVARWPNWRFDNVPRRVEHWINAVEQGQAAADSLLDGRERAEPFMPIPRFWSEQHGVKIQSVGMPSLADRVALFEGNLEKRSFVAAYLQRQKMVGAISFDAPQALLQCAEIVEAANPVPWEAQAEPQLVSNAPGPRPLATDPDEPAPLRTRLSRSVPPIPVRQEPVAAPTQLTRIETHEHDRDQQSAHYAPSG